MTDVLKVSQLKRDIVKRILSGDNAVSTRIIAQCGGITYLPYNETLTTIEFVSEFLGVPEKRLMTIIANNKLHSFKRNAKFMNLFDMAEQSGSRAYLVKPDTMRDTPKYLCDGRFGAVIKTPLRRSFYAYTPNMVVAIAVCVSENSCFNTDTVKRIKDLVLESGEYFYMIPSASVVRPVSDEDDGDCVTIRISNKSVTNLLKKFKFEIGQVG